MPTGADSRHTAAGMFCGIQRCFLAAVPTLQATAHEGFPRGDRGPNGDIRSRWGVARSHDSVKGAKEDVLSPQGKVVSRSESDTLSAAATSIPRERVGGPDLLGVPVFAVRGQSGGVPSMIRSAHLPRRTVCAHGAGTRPACLRDLKSHGGACQESQITLLDVGSASEICEIFTGDGVRRLRRDGR